MKNLNKTEIISTDSNSIKFHEEFKKLLILIQDHPFFQSEVLKIRNKYILPKTGFDSVQEIITWKNKDLKRKDDFVVDVDILTSEFNFPNMFRNVVYYFIHDFILCPNARDKHIEGYYQNRPLVILTGSNKEDNKYIFKPDTFYIEVSESTNKRDVDEAYKKITDRRKTNNKKQISKIGDFTRKAWLLSQEGFSDVEILREIKSILKKMQIKKDYSPNDMSKYVSRYKDSLSKLRKL